MISEDFVNKYSAQKIGNEASLGFPSEVGAFATSTLVDVGTTIFNSVIAIPKLIGVNTDEYKAETYDLLRMVNEDYANYFSQNKDTIETASFIGGLLLPSGAAFKGMKLLQSGRLGFYPTALSDVTQTARIKELQSLLELGKKSTSDFRNLRWKILTTNAGQELAQVAGAEVAIIGSMNSHVWMEDYLKDPITNFGVGMVLGGVLGTGVGQLVVRKQLRDQLGAIATEATDKVISKLIDIPLGISDVDKVQRFNVNAQILRDIESNTANNELTRQIAGDFATKWEGMVGKMEQTTVFGPALKASKDPIVMQGARTVMLSDAAFGANRVDLLTYDPKEFTKSTGTYGDVLATGRVALEKKFPSEPELRQGFVRLYRAERPKDQAPSGGQFAGTEGIPPGSWYVRDKSLLPYKNPGYYNANAVKYIDIPANEVEKYNLTNHPKMQHLPKYDTHKEEYVIPSHLISEAKDWVTGDDAIRRALFSGMGRRLRQTMTKTEGLKAFTPDWAKLMKEEFKSYYSPFHKAWIPANNVQNYARAVDTGVTDWKTVNVMKPNPDAFSEFAVREVPTSTADSYWINRLGTVANATIPRQVDILAGDLGVQNAWLSRLSGLKAEGKVLPIINLIPETAGGTANDLKKQGRHVTLEDLEFHLMQQKQDHAKVLMRAGASLQEIGIRLNIPQNTLERMLMEGKSLGEAGNWRAYTDAGAISTEYLGQGNRILSFTTNGHRISSLAFRNADMSANLDAAKIKQQNRELMATIIAESGSVVAKDFYSVLNKDDKVWDLFEQQLGNIVNEKSGSFFFSSADFASRDMGDIGRIASIKGQEFFGVANNVSQKVLTNLSSRVRTATQHQIGINEFNEVINILQGTSGYRDIDAETGMLYRLIEQEPGVFMREALRRPDGRSLEISEEMMSFLKEMRNVSRELWSMKNTINRIQGFKELNDIGLWIPSFNPINKFISYVIDTEAPQFEGRVKLLIGKSPEQLADLERNWKNTNGSNNRFKLVTKAQQEDYNFWQMRQDPTEMDMVGADISKFHSGASASAVPVYDDSFASTIIENLHNRIIFYGRKMQEMYLDDIMNTLDQMSAVNQKYFAEQPSLLRSVGLSQREDAARAIKNTLLGNSQLGAYSTWQTVNNGFASMIEWTSRKSQEFYNGLFEVDTKTGTLKKSDYVRLSEQLESHGVKNPFKTFNEYVTTSQKPLGELRLEFDPENSQLGKLFIVKDKDGKQIAGVEVERMSDELLYVHNIATQDGKNTLGPSVMREVAQLLKREYPGITKLSGHRVTGVREKAGTTEIHIPEIDGFVPTTSSMPTFSLPRAADMTRKNFANDIEKLRATELARKHSINYESAERIIAAGNSILATVALRVMETGHALVTAISWPIMAMPEIYRALPKTYMGNALGEGIQVPFGTRVIYDGIRFRHSDAAKPLIERWIAEGFGSSIVSEATRLNTLITSGGKGAIAQINKIIESDLIKTLSKPSDFAESESRLWVLATGYQLARRMYPGISNVGADMFAKEFMTRTIGNYYSVQRPAMFQGTLGVAMGLFQTYMLSWMQSAFRSIENRQFKALAAQSLTQSALFGMGTMPMYDLFSKTIGEHFSDKHYDLQSGTYRALPDSLAEFVVYGLPASMGVGLYTRGDMQPRIPFTGDSALDTIAAVNATRQAIGAMGHTMKKMYDANGLSDKFRGLLEGIAMQSLSRPIARIVETVPLPDGQGGFKPVGSISREGNTISTAAEVWSVPGVLSRLLASRSTEEQVKREVDYLNSFYGSVDHANRKEATEALKTSIRGGNLTPEKLEETARTYLRTGTATGWRAALNEALATSEGGIDYKLGKRLRPDSPLIKMIDENY